MSVDRDECWQVDDLTISVGSQTVTRGSARIVLPQLSFKFLLALIRASPRLLSLDELMEQVWAGIFVNGETVTQRAKLLRDALGDDPRQPRYFTVRRGAGYQLLPAPARIERPLRAQDEGPGPGTWPRLGRTSLIAGAIAAGFLTAATGGSVPLGPDRQVPTAAQPLRVAVLTFDNLSSDPADAFIARSIPEMVLNRLSTMNGLSVIARDSALLSPAAHAPVGEAAQQLSAAFVVRGSVQRIGDSLRVTCFVVDARRQTRIWSERFDWNVDRLYALQDRIADRVAASLESRAEGLGHLRPASPTPNSDAYLAYLRGKALLTRYTVAETDAAAVQFERAVDLDSQFADAMVALYDARMQGADLRRDDLGPFRARYQPMLDRALKLEPDSGPALFAKAMWSNEPADVRLELFRRAAQRDPSNSRGLTAFAEFLDKQGGSAITHQADPEGKVLLDRVLAIDPLSPRTRFWAVQRQWTAAPTLEHERALARELQLDPNNYPLAVRRTQRLWFVHGETAKAIESMERVIATDPQQPWGPQVAFAFYLDANDPVAARVVAESTPASRAGAAGLLAQYRGDWQGAGAAAFGRGGYLFNEYQSWNWAEAVRDWGLHTRQYDRAASIIAARFGFDLANPRTGGPAQANSAPALAHILIAKGDKSGATRLLAQTVQWIDTHPSFGMAWHLRDRATAMMLLGQRDEALSNLRASFETGHDVRYWWYVIDHDPVWAPVRSDPRFMAIAQICRDAARVERSNLDALRRQGKIPPRPGPHPV